MNDTTTINYLAIIEQHQQEELTKRHHIHDNDSIPTTSDKPVDYIAIAKAWDEIQAGKYIINSHARKRNPSHDPEYR